MPKLNYLNNFRLSSQDEIFISDTSLNDYVLPNGDYYKGSYDSNGYRHGYGLYMFQDGTKYLGNYNHGVRSGYGVITYPDESKYAGTWSNNMKNGYGSYTYSNGDVYKGRWYENKRHGTGLYNYTCNEEKYSYYGTWVNGKRCGPAELDVNVFKLYAIFKDRNPVGPALFTFSEKWMCSGYFLKEVSMEKSSSNIWIPQKISAYDSNKIPQRTEIDIDLDQIGLISSTESFSSWLFSVVGSEELSSELISKIPSIKKMSEALDQFEIIGDIASLIIRTATLQEETTESVLEESLTKLKSAILSLKSFLLHSPRIHFSPKASKTSETDHLMESIQDMVKKEDSQGPFLESISSLTTNIDLKSRVSLPSSKQRTVSFDFSIKEEKPEGFLPSISENIISTAVEQSQNERMKKVESGLMSKILSAANRSTESIFSVLNKFQIADDIAEFIVNTVLNTSNFTRDIEQMKQSPSDVIYILDTILLNVVANKYKADV